MGCVGVVGGVLPACGVCCQPPPHLRLPVVGWVGVVGVVLPPCGVCCQPPFQVCEPVPVVGVVGAVALVILLAALIRADRDEQPEI